MTTGKSRLVTAAAVLAWLLSPGRLCAQVTDLPPVTGPSILPGPGSASAAYWDRAAWLPDSSVEVPSPVPRPLPPMPPQPFPDRIEPENPDRPPDARDGMFQKLIFNSTWLAPGGANGLGMSELEWKTVLGFPVPSRRSPLVVTPGFSVDYLEEPAGSDLPPRVYEATVEFRWWKRFTPRFGIDFLITPGVYSDFEQSTDEAIRTPGHVVGRFEWTPTLDVVLGLAYLDREDLDFLPVGGLVWKPRDDVKLEMVFPRPRVARRVYWFGAMDEEVQDWLYVAGEFGTKTWAIRRTGGANDVLTYRDCRLLLGVERKALRGLDTRFEVGYVFSRQIEFVTDAPDLEPDDTVLLRAGLTY
jgi:hypothetical protein